jgi:hypothetical protein
MKKRAVSKSNGNSKDEDDMTTKKAMISSSLALTVASTSSSPTHPPHVNVNSQYTYTYSKKMLLSTVTVAMSFNGVNDVIQHVPIDVTKIIVSYVQQQRMIVFTNNKADTNSLSQSLPVPVTVISMSAPSSSTSVDTAAVDLAADLPYAEVLTESHALHVKGASDFGSIGTIGDYIYHVTTFHMLTHKPQRTVRYHMESGEVKEMAPMNKSVNSMATVACVLNDRFYVGGKSKSYPI